MEDRTKICWNCNQATMRAAPELGTKWYICSKCGATYDKIEPLAEGTIFSLTEGPIGKLSWYPHTTKNPLPKKRYHAPKVKDTEWQSKLIR